MALYCGIDLHSSNSVIAVLDDQDCRVGNRAIFILPRERFGRTAP